MDGLAPRFHLLAADAFGAGNTPAWAGTRPANLQDEMALLEPVFTRAGKRFAMVAHSYGAATALVTAVTQPHRVRALAVYEPVLFGLLDAHFPSPNEADGIRNALASAGALLDAGNLRGAAECFVDFWSGEGTWERMPESRKASVAVSARNIRNWTHGSFDDPTPLDAFSRLDIPVLYMVGKESPEAALGVARLLTRVLPQVEVVEFEGLGHMGPVTHPEIVNAVIARFLEKHFGGDLADGHAMEDEETSLAAFG